MSQPNKRLTNFTKFNDDWLKKEQYKNWLTKIDNYNANCRICNSTFSIKYKGLNDIKTHFEGKKHKDNETIQNKNQVINSFFVNKKTKEENNITAAEVSLVYHSIQHHNSYM